MAHTHVVYDSDPHFSINPDSRVISYTSSGKPILIQGDHNSEIVTFDLPRYIDGHDMMLCNLVQVHYINIDGNNSNNRNNGVYEVIDLQVDAEDENTCVCSWIISRNATLFVGSLNFVLRFACTTNSKIDYAWNTTVNTDLIVSTSIDNSDIVVEQYSDVLESWYWELVSAGTTGVNVVVEARDEAVAEITALKEETLGIINQLDDAAIDAIDSLTEQYTSLESQVSSHTDDLTNIKPQVQLNTDNIIDLQYSVENNTNDLTSLKSQVETNTSDIESLETRISEIDTTVSSASGIRHEKIGVYVFLQDSNSWTITNDSIAKSEGVLLYYLVHVLVPFLDGYHVETFILPHYATIEEDAAYRSLRQCHINTTEVYYLTALVGHNNDTNRDTISLSIGEYTSNSYGDPKAIIYAVYQN